MVQAAKVDAQATYSATVSGDRLAAQTAQSPIELAAPYPMNPPRAPKKTLTAAIDRGERDGRVIAPGEPSACSGGFTSVKSSLRAATASGFMRNSIWILSSHPERHAADVCRG